MVNLQNRIPAVTPVAAAPPTPADLPVSGDPRRWPQLQRLRRLADLQPLPWLAAIEAGTLALEADLVAILAPHLDAEGAARLLACWLRQEPPDPAIPPLLGHRRDPLWADRLRAHLAEAGPERRLQLLPLLGAQRDPADFPLLRSLLLDPGPLALRLAALEALSLGLSAWPLAPLRAALLELVGDLQPALARGSLDLLARLPGARRDLLRLASGRLDPALEPRLRRRLAALPAAPLLLLVHGRAGGSIPEALQRLAEELQQRRGAPVQLLALTDPQPPRLPAADPMAAAPTLVPLLLLPGSHVRHDLPRLAAELRRQGPLRRLPFLGSWPQWQRALAAELAPPAAPGDGDQATPLLLHHPLQGALAERYLALLARRCGAVCRATGFEDGTDLSWLAGAAADREPALRPPSCGQEAQPAADPAPQRVVLPLALAANRLTERLAALAPSLDARPLLQRPRLRRMLVEALEALP